MVNMGRARTRTESTRSICTMRRLFCVVVLWVLMSMAGAQAAAAVELTASPASISPGQTSTLTSSHVGAVSNPWTAIYDVTDGVERRVDECASTSCTARR